MATNYHLYQSLMDDLQVAFRDEPTMKMYASYVGKEETGVEKYVGKLEEVFEVRGDDDQEDDIEAANAGERIRRLVRKMTGLSEEK